MANNGIVPYICDQYISKAKRPLKPSLTCLLPDLLQTLSGLRIIVDGLDEWEPHEQKVVLEDLTRVSKASGPTLKLLLSLRDVEPISRTLKDKPIVSLRDERPAIKKAIGSYVTARLIPLQERFGNDSVIRLGCEIMRKADECGSGLELESAVRDLPAGLNEAYDRMIMRIEAKSRGDVKLRERALRSLWWLAFRFRPLKEFEIQDGVVFDNDNIFLNLDTKLKEGSLDLCKPLIERRRGGLVDFFHFSVKEYLKSNFSRPYLDPFRAHCSIAISCAASITSNFTLLDPKISLDEKQRMIANGFHGLHSYANEFWIHHLIECSQFVSSPRPADFSALIDQCLA
ncbi:MAG: hypothetical protein M1834_007905 [Cirrosporium novae-zelandiae]|nr:MAG: hypothetical protein M1834_007905 [Cirrosporium novae-zelandiae]